MMSLRAWASSLVIAVGVLLVYGRFYQSRDWNNSSRALLTFALAEQGTIEITDYVVSPETRQILENPPTWDLASPDKKRYYCDKAPGISWLAVPIHSLNRSLGLVNGSGVGKPLTPLWPAMYWLTLFSTGLLNAGFAGLVWYVAGRAGVHSIERILLTAAVAVGSPTIAYSTLFYGHVPTGVAAACGLLAWRWNRHSIWSGLLAGGLVGFAVVAEYPMVMLAASLGLVHLLVWMRDRQTSKVTNDSPEATDARRASLQWLLGYVIGGLVWAGLLGWYHTSISGSPWVAPYRFEVRQDLFSYHSDGVGIKLSAPTAEAFSGLTISPSRGLLVFTPWLIMVPIALVGILMGRRSRNTIGTLVITLLTTAGLLLFYSAFPTWTGGLATGPRFLVPMIFLWILVYLDWLTPTRQAAESNPVRATPLIWLGRMMLGLLVGAGFLLNVACTTMGARLPERAPFWVALDQHLKSNGSSGFIGPNLYTWLGKGRFEAQAMLLSSLTVTFGILLITFLAARLVEGRRAD